MRFSERTKIILNSYFRERDMMIVEDLNRKLFDATPVVIWNLIIRAGERLGEKFRYIAGEKHHIHPHMLRHSIATHLLETGKDLLFIQKALRHESIATTQIYTHLSDIKFDEEYKKWLNKDE